MEFLVDGKWDQGIMGIWIVWLINGVYYLFHFLGERKRLSIYFRQHHSRIDKFEQLNVDLIHHEFLSIWNYYYWATSH